MKSKMMMSILVMTLLAALVQPIRHWAQGGGQTLPSYRVTDLGTLGGTFSLAAGMNEQGWVNGFSTLSGDTVTHTFLVKNGVMTDLGTLGGPNSSPAFSLNAQGQITGCSDTETPDPYGENFCFGTGLIDLPFLWTGGVMRALPTLGGNNGVANEINSRGQVVGIAENTTLDPTCVPPQFFQFKPVIWNHAKIQELPTLYGDPDGYGVAINDYGQVVGISGDCTFSVSHALLWQNGVAIDLGSFGGSYNAAIDINDQGQVIGQSNLAGDLISHTFLWQNGKMTDLGTLPGDVASTPDAINMKSQVVGGSFDQDGNGRAFLWQNGVMTDLNTLIPANSSLYLIEATHMITASGQIAGYAIEMSSYEIHAFLLTPTNGVATGGANQRPKLTLPENVRRLIKRRLTVARFKPGQIWAE